MSKKRGDRKDGKLLKKIDSMHYIMPLMYPNRCDNEACMNIRIDLTKAEQYLANKNADNPEYKYNLFQVVLTAVLKTVKLRPKMNYFIANGNMYERNDLTAARLWHAFMPKIMTILTRYITRFTVRYLFAEATVKTNQPQAWILFKKYPASILSALLQDFWTDTGGCRLL